MSKRMSYHGVADDVHNVKSGLFLVCEKVAALFASEDGHEYVTVFPLRTESVLPVAVTLSVEHVTVVCRTDGGAVLCRENSLKVLINTKSKACVFELDGDPGELEESKFIELVKEMGEWADTQA